MKKKFYKYQSLGNDFIIFDWYKKNQNSIDETLKIRHRLISLVQNSCKRHFGVGADGILILKKDPKNFPQALIFNSDGSKAEICLNGLRCIAHHLYTHHNFAHNFKIKMGKKVIECVVQNTAASFDTICKANHSGWTGGG